MIREVDVQEFAAAQRRGALVVDVREPSEYADGHVPSGTSWAAWPLASMNCPAMIVSM